jgi:hypothetical protein
MTSKYFNYFKTNKPEHKLLDSLTAENVKLTGFEVYYIPKEYIKDKILFEAKSSSYENWYRLDVNIENSTAWDGNPMDLMTKFGFQPDNRATVKCAIKTFQSLKIPNRDRPYPGDLLYFPFSTNYMEITDMQDEFGNFYGWGKLTIFTMITEIFKFNHEEFNTGNSEIDLINTRLSETVQFDLAQNADLKLAAQDIRDISNNIFGGL